jgi:hypothetical protein
MNIEQDSRETHDPLAGRVLGGCILEERIGRRGMEGDARADLYSLGATLHYMLSGIRPQTSRECSPAPLGLLFLISMVARFAGAMGGGIVLIPVLTFLGIDIKHAIAIGIVSVIATSSGAAAAYVRDRLSNRAAMARQCSRRSIISALVSFMKVPGARPARGAFRPTGKRCAPE